MPGDISPMWWNLAMRNLDSRLHFRETSTCSNVASDEYCRILKWRKWPPKWPTRKASEISFLRCVAMSVTRLLMHLYRGNERRKPSKFIVNDGVLHRCTWRLSPLAARHCTGSI